MTKRRRDRSSAIPRTDRSRRRYFKTLHLTTVNSSPWLRELTTDDACSVGQLEGSNLLVRLHERGNLRQDRAPGLRRVADERTRARHPPHRRVEPGEALVGNGCGNFGTVSPGKGIFVRDDHAAGLLHAREHRLAIP